jgi:thiol-disulfide isomerase/thioredoxin
MGNLSASGRRRSEKRALRWLRRGMALLLLAWVAASSAQPVDFRLPDIDGQWQRLSDYRGQWVVVNYWATWCPPCLRELPELEAFHADSVGSAVVLGVNMEDIGDTALRRFVDDLSLSFPILVAGVSPERSRLVGPVDGLPTTYLVSPTGEPVARQVGEVTAEALHRFIRQYEARHASAP